MDLSTWTLQDWTNVAQIIGIAIAVAALAVTAVQARQAAATSKAQFWLDLRRMFADHQDVHVSLRPGGKWSTNNSGPSSSSDWVAVEAYMGLFEHCERMIISRLIDIETFKSIYGYRIKNLLANRVIVDAKLHKSASGWQDFISLVRRLGLTY